MYFWVYFDAIRAKFHDLVTFSGSAAVGALPASQAVLIAGAAILEGAYSGENIAHRTGNGIVIMTDKTTELLLFLHLDI